MYFQLISLRHLPTLFLHLLPLFARFRFQLLLVDAGSIYIRSCYSGWRCPNAAANCSMCRTVNSRRESKFSPTPIFGVVVQLHIEQQQSALTPRQLQQHYQHQQHHRPHCTYTFAAEHVRPTTEAGRRVKFRAPDENTYKLTLNSPPTRFTMHISFKELLPFSLFFFGYTSLCNIVILLLLFLPLYPVLRLNQGLQL